MPALGRRAGRHVKFDKARTNRTGECNPVRCALRAPVAQWIEQPPPKGQVGRSIRLRGASPEPAQPPRTSARLHTARPRMRRSELRVLAAQRRQGRRRYSLTAGFSV